MQCRTHMLKDSKPSWLSQVQFLSIVISHLCAKFPTSSSLASGFYYTKRLKSQNQIPYYTINQTDISEHESFRQLWSYFISVKFLLFSPIHSANPTLFKLLRADLLEVSSSFWSIALSKQLYFPSPSNLITPLSQSSFLSEASTFDFYISLKASISLPFLSITAPDSSVVMFIRTFISVLSTEYQIWLLCALTNIPHNTVQLIFSFCFNLALHTTYCMYT